MSPNDQFLVANVDGLGGQDLYVANTRDLCQGYLTSLLSTGTALTAGVRYDRVVPGWANLYVYNLVDYSATYLGRLLARPDGFQGSFQSNTIGKWNLAVDDVFHVGNFDGRTPRLDDLVVHNDAITTSSSVC